MQRKTVLTLALLAPLALISAGCVHSQIPSSPTVPSCPTAQVGNWTQLDTGTEVTGTSSKDTPATGAWCYAVESADNAVTPAATSAPSNVVLVQTTAALPVVDLNWIAPSSSPVPITGYIRFRIAANQSTIGAPTSLGTTTSVSQLEKSQPKSGTTQLAANSPVGLRGAAARK